MILANGLRVLPGRFLLSLLAAFLVTSTAYAGGPRWYTGLPYYWVQGGQPLAFFTNHPLYYTDPGPLNAHVTHAQADVMVAQAAATWNVPTSSLTLAQGGTLAEHVSSANTYFDGTSVVFPDDLKLANYHAMPIAIVYDTDGSVIDTLLGSGASSPSSCRQNGVVESVDGLDPMGTIDHAVLILNGRCVGSTAGQLSQMQYQLMRKFGRILGMGWSQLNDNVFTGLPAPTAIQLQNWPVMHPIDVICGPYTYQCMTQPFTLRIDDLSTLAQLYPVTAANITTGKTLSGAGAIYVFGIVAFPTQQGMDAVNMVLRRQISFTNPDAYETISAVTGGEHQQIFGNPITGPQVGVGQSSGTSASDHQGWYIMQRVPIVGPTGWESLYVTPEPINPLYSGDYAIAPYVGQPKAMSGTPVTFLDGLEIAGRTVRLNFTMSDAPSSCNPGNDGQEWGPAAADPSGWWNGLLCANYHTSWTAVSVKAGHSFTMETTAVDENGIGSAAKAHLLMGVWNITDPGGTLPTVSATPSALNARVVGMTQLHMDATGAAQTYRVAIADERGDGRPDFMYKARFLYADTISPVQVGPAGGRITITGQGFRSGNVVTINGAPATVVSWSATQIVATAPNIHAANLTATGFADVAVTDAGTGGTTVIQAALSYGGAGANSIVLVSAPGQVQAGTASATPFAVRVYSPDGVALAAGATVQISATGAAATFGACGAAACTLTTNASGIAQTFLTATAAGAITLTATEQSSGTAVQATVNAVLPPDTIALVSAPAQVQTGTASTTAFAVRVMLGDGVTPAAFATVHFVATGAAATFAACGGASCALTTDSSGIAQSYLTAAAAGVIMLTATEQSGGAWVQATVNAVLPPDTIALVSAPAQVQTGVASTTAFAVRVMLGDGVTPASGATVHFVATGAASTFSVCGLASCTVTTNSSGLAQSFLTATVTGAITLMATEQSSGASVQATVNAVLPPDTIALVLAPAQVQTGTVSSTAFSVRVMLGDGVTPAAGASVRFVATGAAATFSACGSASCTLTANASGVAQTYLTATAAGTVTLTAIEQSGGASVQATVNAVLPPDTIALVSAPTQVQTGIASTTAFAVRVLLGDGVTPAAGATVHFVAGGAASTFAPCGAASCTLTTNASGIAQTFLTATAVGSITLTATEQSSGASVQATVNAVLPPDTIALVSAPAQVQTGVASTTAFAVRVMLGDGVTPAAGATVHFVATGAAATFSVCGAASCTLTTNASGVAQTALTATAPGTMTLTATEQSSGASVQATVNAVLPPDTIALISSPAQVQTGTASAVAFSVRVLLGDGVTPAANATVRFVSTGAAATFSACGSASCTVATNGSGIAQSFFTATAAGTVILTATEQSGGASVQATVTAVLPPDIIALVSAPAQVQIGAISSTPFAVRVLLGDAVTPAAGATVHVVATGAAATFAACGAASCTLTSNANGIAQTNITASAAGAITLTATEQSSGASVQASVTAVPPPVLLISTPTAPRYLAAGAAASWSFTVAATQNGAPAGGQAVAWSAGNGISLGSASGVLDSSGSAAVTVSTTSLAGGAQATVQGCAWTTICATASAFGVDPSQWIASVASGAGQSLQAAQTLAPVVLLVTDLAGHPVQSATVNVYQTVVAWEGICPATGRCPAAPVLATSQATLTTDASGNVSITPLELPGIASVVRIAAVTGTQGFVSLSLSKTP
jgi:hypothetical protein